MSYLETLNSHNAQIQNLINKANSLPEAGSGGSGSSFPYTITVTDNIGFSYNIYYDNINCEAIVICSSQLGTPNSYEVAGCQLKDGFTLSSQYCYISLHNFTENATLNLNFINLYA